MQSRRLSKRLPSILEGRIRSGPEASQIPCTIRDLSMTGARIWLPGSFGPPGEFELEIPMLEQTVRVRRIWSKAQNHGVEFLDALRKPTGDEALDLLEKLQNSDQTS
jgi:hypothetical protein